jgi:hypothetical protein
MIRRLGIFLIGVVLGLMIIRFAFPGRFAEYSQYFSLDYRVLYHLNQDTIYISPKAQCHIDCLDIEQSDVLIVLNDGQVNFDKSIKNGLPCKTYVVEKGNLSTTFELCDQKVKLIDFTFGPDSCNCN